MLNVHPVLFLLPFDAELRGLTGDPPDGFIEIAAASEMVSPELVFDAVPVVLSNHVG